MWKLSLLLPIVWIIATSSSFHGYASAKSHTGCNVTLDKDVGSFTNNKTLNTSFTCYWEIAPKNKTSEPVSLFFYKLFIDDGDEVMVYEKLVNDSGALEFQDPILKDPIKAQNGSVTLVTGNETVLVVLTTSNSHYMRDFEVIFRHDCIFPPAPDVEILHSPIFANNVENPSYDCVYSFNPIPHKRVEPIFTFLQFNIKSGSVKLEDSTADGVYTNSAPPDFFIESKKTQPLKMTVDLKLNTTDSFILKITEVDKSCSEYILLTENDKDLRRSSPPEVLNNGTIVQDCRWIIHHSDSNKVLGLTFTDLNFQNVLDIVAVNDGLSELSTPILQVTTSNRNSTENTVIRSTKGAKFWIAFKPVTYASRLAFDVSIHDQGGYINNSGTISMVAPKDKEDQGDIIYLLEVPKNEIVMLSFSDSSFTPKAALLVYDDFDRRNLLTTIRGPVKYPVLSSSSRMMVVGANFTDHADHITASFKGVPPGCNVMSTPSAENYILTKNCNSTCIWVLSPQTFPNSDWIMNFQYLSLNAGDLLEIHQLDAELTKLGAVTSNVSHVPHMTVNASLGALVKVTQAACKASSDEVVLIGHASIIPDCNKIIELKSLGKIQISSPRYPDTYPLFSNCQWNVTVPKGAFVHLAFEKLKLAENHCVKITDKTKQNQFDGDSMPDDLFVEEDVVIEFDSWKCDKKKVGASLTSDVGFLLNVTVADYVQILAGNKSGEFSTTPCSNQAVCIWKVDVANKSAVNTISYSMSKKDHLENYELSIYDGASVRDNKVLNDSQEIWSNSSQLIFIYRRLNVSEKSSVLTFKYNTITCNSTMLCDNKKCLHPDWRCNGANECGDFTDERDCGSVPVSPVDPEEKFTGYSSTSFWLCAFAMLLLGVVCTLAVPVCYRKYKDSRYNRFRELSGIDG